MAPVRTFCAGLPREPTFGALGRPLRLKTGTEPWGDHSAATPGVAGTPAIRDLLEGVVSLQLRAAAILRTNRMGSEAARAEQFAARARLMLDEPKATRRVHLLTQALYESPHAQSLLERALEGAMALIGGDFGNVQLSDPANGSLRIAAQHGFGSEFLEYFAIVDGDTSACGRAASRQSQTVIADVKEDAAFAPHRDIAAGSGFRAVHSTPLVDPVGRLRGVISIHYRRSHRPSSRNLELMQWLGEIVGGALAHQENKPTTGNGATAIQESARLARDRARQERERARALAGQRQARMAARQSPARSRH